MDLKKDMARTLQKAKGRRERGAFIAVPCNVISSDNYKKLSAKSVKLLFDVAAQLRLKTGGPINNGDLCITPKILSEWGWTSRDSLYSARDELLHYGFISLTRQGGRNLASLYAITFFAINECNGKLDVTETRVASNDWKQSKSKWEKPTKGSRAKIKSLYRFSPSVVPTIGTVALFPCTDYR